MLLTVQEVSLIDLFFLATVDAPAIQLTVHPVAFPVLSLERFLSISMKLAGLESPIEDGCVRIDLSAQALKFSILEPALLNQMLCAVVLLTLALWCTIINLTIE